MNIEYKSVSFQNISETSDEWSFKGLASTYDNIDRTGDVMVRGCFSERLRRNTKVKMMLDHSYDFENLVGMADLQDSEQGLIISMSFDKEDELHQKIYRRLKDGSLDSLSIGFLRPSPENIKIENDIRYITKADLVEVSFVFMPANPKAKITEIKNCGTLKEAEKILREAGLSRSESKALISVIKKSPEIQEEHREDEKIEQKEDKTLINLLDTKLTNLTEKIKCLTILQKY